MHVADVIGLIKPEVEECKFDCGIKWQSPFKFLLYCCRCRSNSFLDSYSSRRLLLL